MTTPVPAEEFEKGAVLIADSALQAIDDVLHGQHCFPIFEPERRMIIRNGIFAAIRAGMKTVADAVVCGQNVSELCEPAMNLPKDTQAPPPCTL